MFIQAKEKITLHWYKNGTFKKNNLNIFKVIVRKFQKYSIHLWIKIKFPFYP